jgi:hypothetical protein
MFVVEVALEEKGCRSLAQCSVPHFLTIRQSEHVVVISDSRSIMGLIVGGHMFHQVRFNVLPSHSSPWEINGLVGQANTGIVGTNIDVEDQDLIYIWTTLETILEWVWNGVGCLQNACKSWNVFFHCNSAHWSDKSHRGPSALMLLTKAAKGHSQPGCDMQAFQQPKPTGDPHSGDPPRVRGHNSSILKSWNVWNVGMVLECDGIIWEWCWNVLECAAIQSWNVARFPANLGKPAVGPWDTMGA